MRQKNGKRAVSASLAVIMILSVFVGSSLTATAAPEEFVYLSEMKGPGVTPWETDTSGWSGNGTKVNTACRSSDTPPITMNGVVYAKGIGSHAASSQTYNLAGQYTRFTCVAGTQDGQSPAGYNLVVRGDGVQLYRSPAAITSTNRQYSIDIDVTGVNTLQLSAELTTTGNSGCWVNWADAKLYFPLGNIISGFTVPGMAGDAQINAVAKTVQFYMPINADVTSLLPTITVSGGVLTPASGTTQNFTTPVTYHLTQEEDGPDEWTVTCLFTGITGFTAPSILGSAAIDNAAKTIRFNLSSSASLSLAPTITIPDGASITPASGATVNFASPVTYTVTFGERTDIWTVTASRVTATNLVSNSQIGSAWSTALRLSNCGGKTNAHHYLTGDGLQYLRGDLSTNYNVAYSSRITIPTTGYYKLWANIACMTLETDTDPNSWPRWGLRTNTGGRTFTIAGGADMRIPPLVNRDKPRGSNGEPLGRYYTKYTMEGIYLTQGTSLEVFFAAGRRTIDIDEVQLIYDYDAPNSLKNITSFTAPNQVGSTVFFRGESVDYPTFRSYNIRAVDVGARPTITLNVPFGTDLTSITPTVALSDGASISPAGAVDFSSGPVDFTATARDGGTQVWEVRLDTRAIRSFDVDGIYSAYEDGREFRAQINHNDRKISFLMPFGTDVKALRPTIALEGTGAVISPASGAAVDFSNGPVTYTVTANGRTETWEVTCTVHERRVSATSSFKFIEDAFNWAAKKSESFVQTGKKGYIDEWDPGPRNTLDPISRSWLPTTPPQSTAVGDYRVYSNGTWERLNRLYDFMPSFWAGYFSRTGFYSRDFCHQVTGGQIIGYHDETFNMFWNFADYTLRRTGDSNRRYSPWALNFDGTLYESRSELPAQYELVEKAYKQYLWSGDDNYIFNPRLWAYYEHIMGPFTDRYATSFYTYQGRAVKVAGNRYFSSNTQSNWVSGAAVSRDGASSYNERGGSTQLQSGDAIGAQYQAMLAWAEMNRMKAIRDGKSEQEAAEQAAQLHRQAQDLKDFFNTTWSATSGTGGSAQGTAGMGYVNRVGQGTSGGSELAGLVTDRDQGFGLESSWFMPIKLITEPGERNSRYLDYIYTNCGGNSTNPLGYSGAPNNIEAFSYLPEAYYPYNHKVQGWRWLKYLIDTKDSYHEQALQGTNGDYPEISFVIVAATVEGLMGMQANAPENRIATVSRLIETGADRMDWIEVSNILFGKHAIAVRHDGVMKSSVTNTEYTGDSGDSSFVWEAQFYGDYSRIEVNGRWGPARQKLLHGNLISYTEVVVEEGQTAVARVSDIEASSVSLDKRTLALTINGGVGSAQLNATVKLFDENGETLPNTGVTWSSSDPAVADVDANGFVTATGVGVAAITVTSSDDSDLFDTCAVTVSEYIALTAVGLPSDLVLNVGGNAMLTPVFTPSDAAAKDLIWASGDPTVATVSSAGVVSGLKIGASVITATSAVDPAISALCTVVVLPVPVGASFGGRFTTGASTSGTINTAAPTATTAGGVMSNLLPYAGGSAIGLGTGNNLGAGNYHYAQSSSNMRPANGSWMSIDIPVPSSGNYKIDFIYRSNDAAHPTLQTYVRMTGASGAGSTAAGAGAGNAARNFAVSADNAVGAPVDMRFSGGLLNPNGRFYNSLNQSDPLDAAVIRGFGLTYPGYCADSANGRIAVVTNLSNSYHLDAGINTFKLVVTGTPSNGNTWGICALGYAITAIEEPAEPGINVVLREVTPAGPGTAAATVLTNDTAGESCDVILAVYDGAGKLVAVNSKHVTVPDDGEPFVVTNIAGAPMLAGYTAKVMVWQDYIPIVKPHVITG